jgi:spore coat protein U-like protein
MTRIPRLTVLILLAPTAGHATCTVSSTGVAFGVYQPFIGSPRDFTGTVTVACGKFSGNGAYNIKLSIGGGASYAGRRMTGAGVNLPYQLYSDAARTLIWGDGTGGSSFVNGSDSQPFFGGTTSFSVFGRIPAGQAVRPNTYTDSITATVKY